MLPPTPVCGKSTSRKLPWPTWYGGTSEPHISRTTPSTSRTSSNSLFSTTYSGIDFKALEDRLDAAFTRKLETMAETFKASWTKPQQSPPPNPILTSSSSASVVPALTLPTPLTPTTLDQPQQAGTGEASIPNPPKLPIKAKPPLPPKLAQSAQVFPLHLDEEDHVHHRMLYLREDLEQDIGQSTDQGVTHIGLPVEVMERSVPGPGIPTQLHHLVRDFLPEHPGLHHPVHETLHALFMKDPPCWDTAHPLQDLEEVDQLIEMYYQPFVSMKEKVVPTLANITPAIDQIVQPHYDYAQGLVNTGPNRETKEDYLKENLGFKFVQKLDQQHLQLDQALLNQNLNHLKRLMTLWKWWYQLQWTFLLQIGASYLQNFKNKDKKKENLHLVIELWGLIGQLWCRKPMKTGAEQKLLVNWSKLVLCPWPKEFVQKNTKSSYIFYTPGIQVHHRWFWGIWLLFLPILGRWHELKLLDRTPLKCPILWALDCLRLLFFDANLDFKKIHGTTSKGASRILAEELIRPGDFPMHQDPHQSGFPAYQKAEEATPSPFNLKQLTKKVLRTSQGSMAAFICGIYAGRYPHQKHKVESNDEAQVLCEKYGIARGQHNFLVATSEHATVSSDSHLPEQSRCAYTSCQIDFTSFCEELQQPQLIFSLEGALENLCGPSLDCMALRFG